MELLAHKEGASDSYFYKDKAHIYFLEAAPTQQLVFRRDDSYLLHLPWMYYCILVASSTGSGRWRSSAVVGAFCSPTQRQHPTDPLHHTPLPTLQEYGEAGIQPAHSSNIDSSEVEAINSALDRLFCSRGCHGIDTHFQYKLCDELFSVLCPDDKQPRGYATYPSLLQAWEKCTPEEVLTLPWPEITITKHTRGRIHRNYGQLVLFESYQRQSLMDLELASSSFIREGQ